MTEPPNHTPLPFLYYDQDYDFSVGATNRGGAKDAKHEVKPEVVREKVDVVDDNLKANTDGTQNVFS
jgi:hypothetical protein